MGDGVSATPADRGPDNEVAHRVITGNRQLGYTCKDLNGFVSHDPKYQKLCKIKKRLEAEPPTTQTQIDEAKWEAMQAFERWQRLKLRKRIREEELEVVKGEMYLRMRKEALRRASLDIRRIQKVLGILTMKEGQGGQEFRAKLSARRASPEEEIELTLREPLALPTVPLTGESETTPSSTPCSETNTPTQP